MKLRKTIFALMASLIASVAGAGEVDESQVPTFEAGTAARAADVNSAFSALISAINDNAAAIATLQAQNSVDVEGQTYRFVSLDVLLAHGADLGGGTPGLFALAGSQVGTMTFSGNAVSGTGDAFEVELVYSEGAEETPGGPIRRGSFGGNTVQESISLDASFNAFFFSADGNVVIGTFSEETSGQFLDFSASTGVIIGVRQ